MDKIDKSEKPTKKSFEYKNDFSMHSNSGSMSGKKPTNERMIPEPKDGKDYIEFDLIINLCGVELNVISLKS